MKAYKHKILVLSDLENTLESTLKSTVSFAKMIDADIEFFYVKQPTEVVGRESQLSAMRSINETYVSTNKKLQNLIDAITSAEDVNINYSYAIGNVKSEIKDRIKITNPDMVIIGKRKPKALGFIGDRVTDFILKNYEGSVVMSSNDNLEESNNEMALGFYSNSPDYSNLKFVNELLKHTKRPIVAFKSYAAHAADKTENENENKMGAIEYTFDNDKKVLDNLKAYLKRSRVNLLCLDRLENSKTIASITNLLDKIDVSLMVTTVKPLNQ